MRARYYDADIGRFISQDPIGFEGDDVNLYAYAGGNPLRFIDPTGTSSKAVSMSRLDRIRQEKVKIIYDAPQSTSIINTLKSKLREALSPKSKNPGETKIIRSRTAHFGVRG